MKKKIYQAAILLLALVFLISGWKLFSYLSEGKKSQNRYEELSAIVEQAQSAPTQTTPAEEETEETEAAPESKILPEYQQLLAYNPDFVGWISIDNTLIDYPVVQTPEDPEYYLYRDFDGKTSKWGCLFADGACDVEYSDNVIIYGHHMNDGSMFADLLDYEAESFWAENPTIQFDTLTEHRNYQIFAVFRTTASVGQGFAYHRFTDAASEAEFDNYVAQSKALSLYNTGIIPAYGEKLICLSTCEYTRENGRFVVMGVYHPE